MLQYGIQGFQLAQLRAVRVPALVLWGAHDTVDSVSAGRRSAQALRAPFHLFANAGHLSMLAAPGAIARAVDWFAALRQAPNRHYIRSGLAFRKRRGVRVEAEYLQRVAAKVSRFRR
jgi:hypothetical protein